VASGIKNRESAPPERADARGAFRFHNFLRCLAGRR
jgi:hypothetical protein